ncbi:MAG: protein-glutamate O-methyltransferase CheR [Clostridiales bacterium]|nr:protein-glutamate O-methyltransferase CheR [Clostridiales bacterium]
MASHPQGNLGYRYFQEKFKALTGIDLSQYKDAQMIRRLESFLQRQKEPSFYTLARRLERDGDLLERLKNYLTINVTEFFRNPERFRRLKEKVLPELFQRHSRLFLWSAGASIGAEAYSLAILLLEERPEEGRGPHLILATDIDEGALLAAEKGEYPLALLKNVTERQRETFFETVGKDLFRVRPEVKRLVKIEKHDLLSDPYPKEVHLILCRNVVIYFSEEAKEQVYRNLGEALSEGGYLLLGSSESIWQPQRFGLKLVEPFLYQKI